jgi:hypothetical protein
MHIVFTDRSEMELHLPAPVKKGDATVHYHCTLGVPPCGDDILREAHP